MLNDFEEDGDPKKVANTDRELEKLDSDVAAPSTYSNRGRRVNTFQTFCLHYIMNIKWKIKVSEKETCLTTVLQQEMHPLAWLPASDA